MDLSHLSLHEFLGKVVRFQKGVCEVYPDGGPPAGEGINVPAVVRLHGCWPTAIDEEDVDAYVLNLRSRPETEFIGYELSTGTWTFRVNHFSTYTVGSDYTLSNYSPRATSSTSSNSPRSTASSASLPPDLAHHRSPDFSRRTLRSQISYSHAVRYVPPRQNRKLVSLVKEAFDYWCQSKPIPDNILEKINAIKLTGKEFDETFPNSEQDHVRAIELLDAVVKFRNVPTGVHGTAIMFLGAMIMRQDVPSIFFCTTDMSRTLCLIVR